jgi:hypothetical protein
MVMRRRSAAIPATQTDFTSDSDRLGFPIQDARLLPSKRKLST